MIVDNFLTEVEYSKAKQFCLTADYKTESDGVDDSEYPDVVKNLDQSLYDQVKYNLEAIKGSPLKDYKVFIRKQSKGVDTPQQCHSDNSLGLYTCILYLTPDKYCQGGTSLVEHKLTGLSSTLDITDYQLEVLKEHANMADWWTVYDGCRMKENRAFIYESHLLHRAEPIMGFGTTNKDSRIILGAFYS